MSQPLTEPFEPPVYRYMPLSSEKRIRYAEDLLLRNRVYYPPMSSFNDPFEGQVNISLEASHEVKIAHVASVIQRRYGISYKDAVAQAPEWIEPNEKEGPERTRKLVQNDWGVWCLSKSNHDIAMWSLYADGHQGICVEFAATRLEHVDFFASIQPVKYTDEMPRVNIYTTPMKKIAQAAFLTKSSRWKEEEECRATVTDISVTNPRERDLPAGIVSAVYLGTRITDENRRRVVEWAKESKSPMTVFLARPNDREYGLEFDLVYKASNG